MGILSCIFPIAGKTTKLDETFSNLSVGRQTYISSDQTLTSDTVNSALATHGYKPFKQAENCIFSDHIQLSGKAEHLSDDGNRIVLSISYKDLPDAHKQRFEPKLSFPNKSGDRKHNFSGQSKGLKNYLVLDGPPDRQSTVLNELLPALVKKKQRILVAFTSKAGSCNEARVASFSKRGVLKSIAPALHAAPALYDPKSSSAMYVRYRAISCFTPAAHSADVEGIRR